MSQQNTTPDPSASQVPLDPATIPQFVEQLPIPRTWAPTLTTVGGKTQTEYTITAVQSEAQMLPTGFPSTRVLAYQGAVKIPGSTQTQVLALTPGAVFDNTRGTPTVVHWRNGLTGAHFMPIDPTLHWANPNAMEPPTDPFLPFPGGYANAQNPVAMVTHNHGLVVLPQDDGIATEWFTAGFQRGDQFATNDYVMPNEQPSTMLFYHDHVMGMTRINVYSGLAGQGYIIRDPNNPLDQASSPLPKGQFEIPLLIQDRQFYTDGQLAFPRTGVNIKNPYWVPAADEDAILVNGKTWPNLNVERRQYRFRALAAGNGTEFNITLDNNGTLVPFTLIGSDGGYLPQPKVVTSTAIATTERADFLVDFSKFAPGTKITMLNDGGDPAETLGRIMQFTVLNTTAVTPPPLGNLVARPTLTANAPTRLKTLHFHTDKDGDQSRSIDGLEFSAPTTEFPLVGSTEEWDLINLGGGEHLIHIHLAEFQVLNRQPIDRFAYTAQWVLMNGHQPITRPITVDPTPFFTGPAVPANPVESGWKDTMSVNPGEMLRVLARWAPQEVPTGGATPGQNQFPIQPVDPTTNANYLWHCHVLGHEDNDMMRKMPLVNLWKGGVAYTRGAVIAFQNVDYRARQAHTSSSTQPPNTRFDLWERVNNNNGTWQPQIIYALGDRVLFNGKLYRSRDVHQAQPGHSPDVETFHWTSFPMTACAQISRVCANNTTDFAVSCQGTAAAGVDADCLDTLDDCMAECEDIARTPCSGLCNNPTSFTVPDGTTFNSGALGTGSACFETTSEIITGSCSGLGTGRELTLNGKTQPCNGSNWHYPLPGQRNKGYCIQVTAGSGSSASFKTF